jgi:hypothetical protein
VQFGCISLQLSQFGNCAKLTPATRNKWTSGWDANWFYCKVPSERGKDFKGPKTYPLSSQMTRLTHEMDVSSSCDLESVDFIAFMEATTLIGGRDVVEEFLARGLQPLGHRFGFLVETKESPLSKITMLMPQIDAAIREQEFGVKFTTRVEKAAN